MPTPAEIRARIEANDGTYNYSASVDLAFLLAEHDRLSAALREIVARAELVGEDSPIIDMDAQIQGARLALDPHSAQTGGER